jgi:NADH-quinone oxidoreductase subunit E/NADP-reducing hydrogenase subunit HndA
MTPKVEFEGSIGDLQRHLDSLPDGQEGVLPALLTVQEMFGYLPESALEFLADECEVTLANILGIATFYSQFSLEPQGEHVIRVCTGTACHVNGAEDIVDRFRSELDVLPGEVTDDGEFTLTTVRCVGACGLAPVVMVDDDVHGFLEPDETPDLIDEYEGGA